MTILMNQIIDQNLIKQVINDNLLFYYKQDDQLSSWLTNRIIKGFKPYGDYEVLYPIETAKNLFEAKLYENIPELLMNLRVEKQRFKPNFLKDDGTSGVYKESRNTNVGYAGFDTENQQQTFEKNNAEVEIVGDRTLEYMVYLDQPFKKWINDFKTEVLNSMVKLIY